MLHISIRLEEKTKKAAAKTLESLGLDMSTAVKMFLQQVVAEQGLPFTPSQNPAFLAAKWDAQVADVLKNSPRYASAEELMADVESDITTQCILFLQSAMTRPSSLRTKAPICSR